MIRVLTSVLLLTLLSFNLTGCIYRVDVPQGNYLDEDRVALLKPGMTREQVQYVLGTPITIDPFNKDRWDYIFLIQEGWKDPVQKNLFVIFENNILSRIEGDYVLGAKPEVSGDESETEL